MPRVRYERWSPSPAHAQIVNDANQLVHDYAEQGYNVTLRQIYYRFVALDLFPDDRTWVRDDAGRWRRQPGGTKNADPNYKWLGDLLNRARLAGLFDWNHMVDRMRDPEDTAHWDGPQNIVYAAATSFRLDKWADQPRRVEVWVEKDALSDVVGRVTRRYDVALFACRGYVSQSAQWQAAQRIGRHLRNGQAVTVLHLGDHDPSGLDMTDDNTGRLHKFLRRDWLDEYADDFPGDTVTAADIDDHMAERVGDPRPFRLIRVALNMDQIRRYDPPPNPTKLTDSRTQGYVNQFGSECWELDALPPEVLDQLVSDQLDQVWDLHRYQRIAGEEAEHRRLLAAAATHWPQVTQFLTSLDGSE
jgi:hypothetical protein